MTCPHVSLHIGQLTVGFATFHALIWPDALVGINVGLQIALLMECLSTDVADVIFAACVSLPM